MSKTQLAYLAGVLDSDGTIGIKKATYSMRVIGDSTQPTYSERIHVRQVERAALELFSAIFGGNIGSEKPSTRRGRMLWRWGLTDAKAASALRELLPFLRIKRQQAKNCLTLRAIKERSKRKRVAKGRGHIGSSPRTAEFSSAMESCYLEAKRLNHVGV